jgi:hypothetical protein
MRIVILRHLKLLVGDVLPHSPQPLQEGPARRPGRYVAAGDRSEDGQD